MRYCSSDVGSSDLYCHTGAFALTASKAGAKSVRGIDRSELCITLATQAAKANGLDRIARFEKADGFEALEKLNTEGARFGIVITDPPNFVKSRKDLGPGSRAYRKLAKLAAPLVAPGGFWFVACRSEEHTSELQSLMRISYAVFCLKKKNRKRLNINKVT